MLEGKYKCVSGNEKCSFTKGKIYNFADGVCVKDGGEDCYTRYRNLEEFNCTNRDDGVKLERAEMTKDDLIAGKHWVKNRKGEIGIVTEQGIIYKEYGIHIDYIKEDLTTIIEATVLCQFHIKEDIIEVFELADSLSMYHFNNSVNNLKSIWKREEKTPQQLKIEEIEKEIECAEASIVVAKRKIENLKRVASINEERWM